MKTNSVFSYAFYYWIKYIKRMSKARISVVGVGIDDKFNTFEKIRYKSSFNKVDDIYVRDTKSKEIIKNTFDINVKLIPDVAYNYKFEMDQDVITTASRKAVVMIYDYPTLKNHFGAKITLDAYYELWYELIVDSNADRYVLAYTTIGDKIETYKFQEYLKREKDIDVKIENTDTLAMLGEVFADAYVVITGRMHGMILAKVLKKNVIPYSVSPKIDSYITDYLSKNLELKNIQSEITDVLRSIVGG